MKEYYKMWFKNSKKWRTEKVELKDRGNVNVCFKRKYNWIRLKSTQYTDKNHETFLLWSVSCFG